MPDVEAPVYVLTEQKLQNLVTSIMRKVNVRINDYIDTTPISSESRADKIASPRAVYNALQTVDSVVPVVNKNKLAVGLSLIPNPNDKVLYIILDSADATDGTPYIFIPDDTNEDGGKFVKVCSASTEVPVEHQEFTDAQITAIVDTAVAATVPVFE